jgi:hypothetical protein
VKIICKIIIPLFLAVILSSCNGDVVAIPTMSQVNIMGTAMSIAKAEVVMTMTAVPTATFPPPTPTLPEPTRIPPESYADKIDYAMAIAPKIYTLLPYINKTNLYGEYSGCIKTYDFNNFVAYQVRLPLETVNAAFLNYFSTEKWEFTEATLGTEATSTSIGEIPKITYDVYRISSTTPAFERLKVILHDKTPIVGTNDIDVRAELTHVETKENLKYLLDPFACYNHSWLWIGLFK